MASPPEEVELAAGIEKLSAFGYLNTLAVLTDEDWTKAGYYLEMNWESWNTLLWRMKEKAEFEKRKFQFEKAINNSKNKK